MSIYEALIYAGVQAGQHWGVCGISVEGSTDSVHGFQKLLFLGSSRKYPCVASRDDPQSPAATSNIPSAHSLQICSWGSAQPRYADHKPAVASVPECSAVAFLVTTSVSLCFSPCSSHCLVLLPPLRLHSTKSMHVCLKTPNVLKQGQCPIISSPCNCWVITRKPLKQFQN